METMKNIWAIAERIRHIEDCTEEDCTLEKMSKEDILRGIAVTGNIDDMEVTFDDIEIYHDKKDLREVIENYILFLVVRSPWHYPGEDCQETEFRIKLDDVTRITGILFEYYPESAILEKKGDKWEECTLTEKQKEDLLTFCRFFRYTD